VLAREQGTKYETILANNLFRVGQATRAQNVGLFRMFQDSWHLWGSEYVSNFITTEG